MAASDQTSPSRRKGRRLCGAKTRAGGCCQVRAEPGKARCRFHGGKSTGPKTEAGRARIAEAQRRRWRAQARLGHASIQMTADRYGHLFPRGDDGAELAAAEKVFLEVK